MKRLFTFRNLLAGVLILIASSFVVPFTAVVFQEKWAISQAVTNARSIRLEHYLNEFETGGKEKILASKDLAKTDFYRVADAFPIGLDTGFPGMMLGCIFNPHHRIIITDAAGKMTVIRVCFECDHFSITRGNEKYGHVVRTPFIWMSSLRNFFADEGMPNSPDLYRRHFSYEPTTNQAPAANN